MRSREKTLPMQVPSNVNTIASTVAVSSSRLDAKRILKFLTAPTAIAIFLVCISLFNYLLFHTAAELFSIIVATSMFLIAWNTNRFSRDNFLMYLAVGYFWIGALDLIHTLAYPGLNIFQITGTNTAVQYWIIARFFEAILLLSAPLFFERKVSPGILFIGFGAGTTVAFGFVSTGMAPHLFFEGVGLTPLKIYSEYAIVGLLSAALLHLYWKRAHLDKNIFYALAASIVLTMAAELAFTFYVSAFGLSNLVGHIFKFTSYWILHRVINRTTLIGPYIKL